MLIHSGRNITINITNLEKNVEAYAYAQCSWLEELTQLTFIYKLGTRTDVMVYILLEILNFNNAAPQKYALKV